MAKLVLAEKPSVAQSLAKVLGATNRKDGYLEGNDYLVSWCVGHLVELAQPQDYDEKYAKWRYADLPIFPKIWNYQVSAGTKKQFQVIKNLMSSKEVTSIVTATDAGREGELIARLVYHQCHCKKPVERLWISSMEDDAIREGFTNLKPSAEYDSLYEAALCRERADWIVGMNATRLFSCLYGQTLNVGRVMTPMLAMVVEREAAIAAFRPENFYTLQLETAGVTASSKRYADSADAEKVKSVCEAEGEAVINKVERKEKAEKPPALYDLTSLQRDANRLLGYTAQQTLDYTQSLYEKKLVTYPRTDSRFLTDDMENTVPALAECVAKTVIIGDENLKLILFQHSSDKNAGANIPWFQGGKQVCNSKGVTDHHAIIPTMSIGKFSLEELSKGEQEILRMIAVRLLCATAGVHRYAETVAELCCGETTFTTKGKEVLEEGWKSMDNAYKKSLKVQEKTKSNASKKGETVVKEQTAPSDSTMPTFQQGEHVKLAGISMKTGKTSPPGSFTEDTLLSFMEIAGADAVPDEVERKGLGTPATRAGVIEKLVRIGLIERKGDKKTKYLIPTHKGVALITVMPEQIQSPTMTADWEEKLLRMEHGEYGSSEFMNEITDMVADLVKHYEVVKDAEVLMPQKVIVGKCPKCGSEVLDRNKGYFCSDKGCKFVLWKDNRFFTNKGKKLTKQMVEKLLTEGKIKLTGCTSEKTTRKYNAIIHLETAEDGQAQFQTEFLKP